MNIASRLRARFVLAAALLSSVATPALAAPNDTGKASATAQVAVLRKLSFIKLQDLDFGNVIPATSAGTVVLAPDGTRTTTGAVRISGGKGRPAVFAGYGDFFGTVNIRMGANTTTLTRAGGTETMTMDTFMIGTTPQFPLTTASTFFFIGQTNGMFSFPIGATLRVKANQTPGSYTGTFTVILNYQ